VDAALLSCPGIKDAVSFAAPDEIYGEVVHCAVVSELATDDTDPNAAAEVQRIRLHCAQKLSAFKVPTRVYLMQEIPKTATGKVQRRLVAEKVLGTA
jgi:acyl-coenzyme A synthetase/AMP-(fatty) acid ligase